VGHEIVGKAVRVGTNVHQIKVGDRVGVGAQARSCLQPDCPECSIGQTSYCSRAVNTYGSVYPNGEGNSYGGYANYNRTNGNFVFPIPDGLASEDAAPMLCAGITVYAALKKNGCGPGKKVGIVGIGGLGHFAILFAKALGADRVLAFSRKESKGADALAMGADEHIATDETRDWTKDVRSLDLILCTASSPTMPLTQYLTLLKVGGTFMQLGYVFTQYILPLPCGSNIGCTVPTREATCLLSVRLS
jgi:alcohol dehydrogenase (NADP+)